MEKINVSNEIVNYKDQTAKVDNTSKAGIEFDLGVIGKMDARVVINLNDSWSAHTSLDAIDKARECIKQDEESLLREEERFNNKVASVVTKIAMFVGSSGMEDFTEHVLKVRSMIAECDRDQQKINLEFEKEQEILKDEYKIRKIKREIEYREELKKLGYDWNHENVVTPIKNTEDK